MVKNVFPPQSGQVQDNLQLNFWKNARTLQLLDYLNILTHQFGTNTNLTQLNHVQLAKDVISFTQQNLSFPKATF